MRSDTWLLDANQTCWTNLLLSSFLKLWLHDYIYRFNEIPLLLNNKPNKAYLSGARPSANTHELYQGRILT